MSFGSFIELNGNSLISVREESPLIGDDDTDIDTDADVRHRRQQEDEDAKIPLLTSPEVCGSICMFPCFFLIFISILFYPILFDLIWVVMCFM